ncbi:hypothetical protein GCM10010182_61280 [Actinomadura cremea]|nr:hypothetical protein GCM10010182_61280 [Actinomadura cremea]
MPKNTRRPGCGGTRRVGACLVVRRLRDVPGCPSRPRAPDGTPHRPIRFRHAHRGHHIGDLAHEFVLAPSVQVTGRVLARRRELQDVVEVPVVERRVEVRPEGGEGGGVHHESAAVQDGAIQNHLDSVAMPVHPGALVAFRQACELV